LIDITTILNTFEAQLLEQQRILTLEIVPKATPARWWAHKEKIEDSQHCRGLIQERFNTHVGDMTHKYIREGNPKYHVAQCEQLWILVSRKEWTHRFIHTLETVPRNWYLELEISRDTKNWDYIHQIFQVTFTFHNASPIISTVLHAIKKQIFT
jgi:hypothetical protein